MLDLRRTMLFLLTLFVVGGCSSRNAMYIDPEFATHVPKNMVVLPVVDARIDTSKSDLTEKDFTKLQKEAVKLLDHRQGIFSGPHIKAKPSPYAINTVPSGREIGEMSDEQLIALAPHDGPAAFLWIIDDVATDYKIIHKSCRAETRACVIDPSRRMIVWKDAQTYLWSQGGLISGLMPMQDGSIIASLQDMLVSMPQAK